MTVAAFAAAEGRRLRARLRRWPARGVLLLWLGLGLAGLAPGDPAHAQSIPLRRYAHDQGLLGLADTCLLQTGNGSLWVCTESGLYRFNGHRFEQVPLQGQRGHFISAASEDAAHRLWVASFDAVFVGDGNRMRQLSAEETGPLRKNVLRLASGAGARAGAGPQALRAVPRGDGRWRLQPLFDAATLARLPQLGRIGAAQADADTLWLGCGQELCRVAADGAVTVYGQAQGLPPDRWRGVVRARDGALWVRGDQRLMRLPAAAERFVEQPWPDAGPHKVNAHAQLLFDPQGRVLMPTGQGLARWEHGRWRRFGRGNGLPDGGIVALLFDHAGDLWMSVDGEGVVRWNGYGWIENWDVTQGMSSAPTWTVQRHGDGALLLGNEGGVNRQRGAGQPFQPWLADAGVQTVGMQTAADGSLWSIGSLGELHHHDRDGRLLRRYPRLGSTAKRLYLDAAGRIWLLTMEGVYLLARPQSGEVPQRVQALPASDYSDIQQRRDGSLWLAGASGVFRLRGDTWTPIRLLLDGTPAQPWVSKLLIEEDGQVWAALYHPGVWQGRLDGDTLRLQRAAQPQLQELQIYLLRRTGNGWIWIGHNQGVDIHDGRRWSRLTQSQGLLWDDISEAAFFEDADASVWIGNSKGVSHVLAPQRLFQERAPVLTLDQFTRGGHPIAAGARLPWNQEPLHIEVGAPDLYDDRNRVSFRYRFAGVHTRWIATPNFEIDHPPLPPGDYVFEIQLLDAYRRSASAPVRVAFSVAPVWWRSPPMLALYALLGGGLAIAALHWRERRLRQRQRELAALVALRTQELEHDKRELEIARAALAVKASHDALTGLLNRAGILDALAAQMQRSQAERQPLAVAMIDLDHFKRINDAHGHLTGDAVLVKVARRLNANLRGSDLIGRYGGEELLGVLPGLPVPSHERLQHLRAAIGDQPLQIGTQRLAVTASIGVAWYRPGESLQQLLARADEALYRAKHLGRNRVELHA